MLNFFEYSNSCSNMSLLTGEMICRNTRISLRSCKPYNKVVHSKIAGRRSCLKAPPLPPRRRPPSSSATLLRINSPMPNFLSTPKYITIPIFFLVLNKFFSLLKLQLTLDLNLNFGVCCGKLNGPLATAFKIFHGKTIKNKQLLLYILNGAWIIPAWWRLVLSPLNCKEQYRESVFLEEFEKSTRLRECEKRIGKTTLSRKRKLSWVLFWVKST